MTFKLYRRKEVAELRPYVPGEDMKHISLSAQDKLNGSPTEGDMICRNRNNHADLWLVNRDYFALNFEPLEDEA